MNSGLQELTAHQITCLSNFFTHLNSNALQMAIYACRAFIAFYQSRVRLATEMPD